MQHSMRVNCIQILSDAELNILFRLTLQIKSHHVELFENPKWVVSYIKNDKIRYMIVFESKDRDEVLKVMRAAQVIILTQKIKEMDIRKSQIMDKLSTQI